MSVTFNSSYFGGSSSDSNALYYSSKLNKSANLSFSAVNTLDLIELPEILLPLDFYEASGGSAPFTYCVTFSLLDSYDFGFKFN